MNSIKVCEYSRSRSFHDDLILQDQASGERSQDHWSSGFFFFAEMTCDFAFTRKHSLSRPIRFDVMSSVALHVYV